MLFILPSLYIRRFLESSIQYSMSAAAAVEWKCLSKPFSIMLPWMYNIKRWEREEDFLFIKSIKLFFIHRKNFHTELQFFTLLTSYLSLFLCAPLYKLSRAFSFFYKQKIYAFHPRTKIKLNGCRFPSRHGEQLERNKWDFSPSHPIFYRVLQKKNVYLDVVTCTLKIVAIALSFLKNLWGFNSPAFNGNRDLMQCNTMLVPLFYLRNKN